MRVARKAVVKQPHVFVQHRVAANIIAELLQLFGGRQLPIDQQVRYLDKIALWGKLLDGVAPIAKDAGLTIEKRDGARRSASVHVAFVERDVSRFGPQLGNV